MENLSMQSGTEPLSQGLLCSTHCTIHFGAVLSGKQLCPLLSLISILIKSTFGVLYILLPSGALNYRAGGVSVC